MTFIYFIITLGILIFVHELGHFIMAKRAGIRVDAFSLGFGPRLFGFKRGETDYRVSALPLGGYVKMLGEDPDDDGADDPRSFSRKSMWARVKVVAFGPLMNFILCIVLMPVVFMIGRTEPVYLHERPVLIGVKPDTPAAEAGLKEGDRIVSIDGNEVKLWDDTINRILISPNQTLEMGIERNGRILNKSVTVGELPEIKGGYIGVEPIFFLGTEARVDVVTPGSPAEAAGLEAGDLVVSFAGRTVTDFYDLSAKVNECGDWETEIVVDRDGKRLTSKIHPAYNAETSRFIIGIITNRSSIGPRAVYRYGFFDSMVLGAKEIIKLTKLTFEVLYRLITLKLSYKVLGGPIIIAKVSAAAAATGLANFLYFMAFLSLQLSILNLLPVPILDGGHLFFIAIEAIRRKPVSVKIRSVASQVGFVILLTFMALITLKDIESVWGVSSWIKKVFNL